MLLSNNEKKHKPTHEGNISLPMRGRLPIPKGMWIKNKLANFTKE